MSSSENGLQWGTMPYSFPRNVDLFSIANKLFDHGEEVWHALELLMQINKKFVCQIKTQKLEIVSTEIFPA